MTDSCFFPSVLIGLLALSFFVSTTHAQSPDPSSTFDPHAAWSPEVLAHSADSYRTGSGHPGPDYWQNRADYTIEARLDTASHVIRGTARIHYTNNSPDSLQALWLQLDQNRFQADSRSAKVTRSTQAASGTSGFQFSRVAVERGDEAVTPDTLTTDTRMQVRLDAPVAPKGGTLDLVLDYRFTVPKNGRTAWAQTPRGPIYEIARWYPRVAVYDDIRGWDTLPFLGTGEFYCEYGIFDYRVTVPASMIVAGTGTLQNPDEVLTATQRRRLEAARRSDETTYIVAPDEVGNPSVRLAQDGMLTWHFRMTNTRDVAWAASPAFVWDAARIDLKHRSKGSPALAMSFYPPSSTGPEAWDRSTEYTKKTIEFFSDRLYPYPWATAVNVAGPVGGMEYPGLAFCHQSATGYALFYLTVHELGHTWFPMIVGSNERRHAWMDEGFNTFIDVLAHRLINDGEFAPKRDGEYAPDGGNPAREIVPVMTDPDTAPIMTYPDVLASRLRHPIHYFKPAFGLTLLRTFILGPERFDFAFQQYVQRWAFKHPTPQDFFRTMNDAAGEDLRWFWKGWFEKTWTLDQAVTDVTYVDGEPSKGALVTLKTLRRLPMPVRVRVRETDGETHRVRLPVEIWQRGPSHSFRVDTDTRLDSVVVDPEQQLPDVNRQNNTWPRGK